MSRRAKVVLICSAVSCFIAIEAALTVYLYKPPVPNDGLPINGLYYCPSCSSGGSVLGSVFDAIGSALYLTGFFIANLGLPLLLVLCVIGGVIVAIAWPFTHLSRKKPKEPQWVLHDPINEYGSSIGVWKPNPNWSGEEQPTKVGPEDL
jgi:hypothetical protein